MKELEIDKLLKKAQVLADDIQTMESIDTEKAFKNIQNKIKRNHRKKMMDNLMRYAALLAVPLLLTSLVFGYLYFSAPQMTMQYAEVTAAEGSVVRYELPDRSVVWLNAGTTLRYPTIFNAERREVELTGEAYFEVTADKKHPFYVNTTNGPTIYVYGTKFNVSAYGDESSVSTVLEQGKVNVQMPTQEEAALNPCEQLIYEKKTGKWIKSKVDVYEKVAWKDGTLIFRNATLDEIFKKLSRHFNAEIEFNNKKNKEYRFRATFRKETLPDILDYLSQSAMLKWKIEDAVQQDDHSLTKKRYIVDLY